MTFSQVQHIVLITYSAYLFSIYLIREPYFLYPALALTLTVVWELAGWSGLASALTMGAVLGLLALIVLGRLIFRRPLLTWKPTNEPVSIWLTMGGFVVFVVFLGLILYVV